MNPKLVRSIGSAAGLALVVGMVWMIRADGSFAGPKMFPSAGVALIDTAQAEAGVAESLEKDFIRVSEQVGPAVVGIATEQIERVRQYYQGHPFFGSGGEAFEEFFNQFHGGEAPQSERRLFGLGSGVIIDARGYVLTNEHVVANADEIKVTLADGRQFIGQIKGKDPRSDLAIVKIDAQDLPFAKLGDSASLRTGQWAIALGNPFGLMTGGYGGMANEPTLTVGVISAMNRSLPRVSRDDRDYSGLIQTDAAINPGNSGGPLVNLQGEVIAINVAILTSSRGSEGVGFAIPINKAKRILDTLIEGRRVVYGWLGVQVQDIPEDIAEYFKLSDRRGVLVNEVLPGAPAQVAGLMRGDIIRSFDGKSVSVARELVEQVGTLEAGREVDIEALRDGKPIQLKLKVGERPSTEEPELTGDQEDAWRGIQVASLSSEYAEPFNLPPGLTGVLVIDVEAGSPADKAGIRPGDIIDEINRLAVGDVDAYRQAVSQIRGNALVRTSRGYLVVKNGQ